MIPVHREYSVEIKKLKFESDHGIRHTHTALVHFHIDGKEQPVVELMGHMEEKEVYSTIDRGEALNLDNCYVDKFSLRDYRLTRNLDARGKVVIKGFTAKNTLFGGGSCLDFSFAVLEGEEFSLEDSWISKEDVSFESAQFRTEISSFHNTRFPEGYLNFKNVNFESSQISFKNSIFGKGEKDFQYLVIDRGNLSFVNAEFSDGDVNFINSDFGKGDVSFKVARFGSGRVDFHFATFKSSIISFERTEFGDGRVDFRTVEFGNGRVNFNRSVFGNSEVNFNECDMNAGKFSFKRAVFGAGDISFEEVVFEHIDVSFEHTIFGEGRVSFYKSWFKSLSLSFCHLNGYVDLRVSQSRSINLSNTVVRDIIDINPHEFRSKVDSISIAGMRLMGRIYLDWSTSGVKQMIYSQDHSGYHLKAEQFRILKENFQSQGLYSDEDRAYVEFKRCESKAQLKGAVQEHRWSAIGRYPLYWFKLALFDKAGLYATSPVRVLITMLTFYILFSIIYVLLILFTSADIIASVDDHIGVVARSFYHSAITFLTIGYGDHYPYGSIRWVSSLEGFFGLFLMSYFTVAFVRKVLR
ncbi:MAG: two pore domain potassium channel family protein [Bacteroidetes bacterium]|nr:two pore domain potassium channel family protein [Bacteroidota bacterium]